MLHATTSDTENTCTPARTFGKSVCNRGRGIRKRCGGKTTDYCPARFLDGKACSERIGGNQLAGGIAGNGCAQCGQYGSERILVIGLRAAEHGRNASAKRLRDIAPGAECRLSRLERGPFQKHLCDVFDEAFRQSVEDLRHRFTPCLRPLKDALEHLVHVFVDGVEERLIGFLCLFYFS